MGGSHSEVGRTSLEFLYFDIPKIKIIGLAVVLQADVALERAILHWGFIQLNVNDSLSVKLYLQVMALAAHDHGVPFAGFFGHILGCANGSNNSTMVVWSNFLFAK